MVRASCSSLKAHRSSSEPPPRTSKMMSITGCRAESTRKSPLASCPSCARRYSFDSACTSDCGAWDPCTRAGTITTGICGTRRRNAVTTSCKAAAPREVTRPIPRGKGGSGLLRAGSNSPSDSNWALRRRNCSNKAPCPARCMLSTTSCRSPRCS
ncbi:hypothetical protein SDC9_192287 [bioreactor metagenome]|uniref:Uncharacterized protein n=1 Tax=bioreactor metagenome TaxID=1076179 RepID=A0A645I1V6_9ZZZZ